MTTRRTKVQRIRTNNDAVSNEIAAIWGGKVDRKVPEPKDANALQARALAGEKKLRPVSMMVPPTTQPMFDITSVIGQRSKLNHVPTAEQEREPIREETKPQDPSGASDVRSKAKHFESASIASAPKPTSPVKAAGKATSTPSVRSAKVDAVAAEGKILTKIAESDISEVKSSSRASETSDRSSYHAPDASVQEARDTKSTASHNEDNAAQAFEANLRHVEPIKSAEEAAPIQHEDGAASKFEVNLRSVKDQIAKQPEETATTQSEDGSASKFEVNLRRVKESAKASEETAPVARPNEITERIAASADKRTSKIAALWENVIKSQADEAPKRTSALVKPKRVPATIEEKAANTPAPTLIIATAQNPAEAVVKPQVEATESSATSVEAKKQVPEPAGDMAASESSCIATDTPRPAQIKERNEAPSVKEAPDNVIEATPVVAAAQAAVVSQIPGAAVAVVAPVVEAASIVSKPVAAPEMIPIVAQAPVKTAKAEEPEAKVDTELPTPVPRKNLSADSCSGAPGPMRSGRLATPTGLEKFLANGPSTIFDD